MSWDAIISGDIRFSRTTIQTWRDSRADMSDVEWPHLIAHAANSEDNLPLGTVRELLASCSCFNDQATANGPQFLDIRIEGNLFSIRALLAEDEYREMGRKLIALICAAAPAGGSGRVQFRDAEASEGAAIVVRGGHVSLECFEAHEPMNVDDENSVREVLELAGKRWDETVMARKKDAISGTRPVAKTKSKSPKKKTG